uniref:Uncharacterized protein n=1 Tax=Solanum lycopersicum TaxID=4081 RepID=K4CEI8_SOLLC
MKNAENLLEQIAPQGSPNPGINVKIFDAESAKCPCNPPCNILLKISRFLKKIALPIQIPLYLFEKDSPSFFFDQNILHNPLYNHQHVEAILKSEYPLASSSTPSDFQCNEQFNSTSSIEPSSTPTVVSQPVHPQHLPQSLVELALECHALIFSMDIYGVETVIMIKKTRTS